MAWRQIEVNYDHVFFGISPDGGARTDDGYVGIGNGGGQGVAVGRGVSSSSGGIVGTNAGVPGRRAGVGFHYPPRAGEVNAYGVHNI